MHAAPKGHKNCTRCQGTGWWGSQFGRVCFKCGGVGYLEIGTLAEQIRNKRAHVDEVRELVATNEALLETARPWSRASRLAQLVTLRAQLVTLVAELAALEAR